MEQQPQPQQDPLFIQIVSLIGQAKKDKVSFVQVGDLIRAVDLADRKKGEVNLQAQIGTMFESFKDLREMVCDQQRSIDALVAGATPDAAPLAGGSSDRIAP